ncbi:DMT family transporter [Marinobacter confluentis]|uniref:EamA/RhaT family transporter n=1 Tax=Marinobacter confluentis TaxID=1697557 RepID=A0A4Z1C8V8_9GAMM|nr:EamA family transporter [Marinobacter confluentis]TGN39468.1 EamA/RhaT family transporter [Marinobacter confluentis]
MVGASIVFVALAAVFWGLAGGIGGILMEHGWDASIVAFYRGAVGLAFVLLWLLIRPSRSGLSDSRVWFWSCLAGLGVAGNFGFYFLSISQSSIAVAATLMYCAPVFVYLVSFALGFERPTTFKLIAIALVMLGIGLLTQIYDLNGSGITWLGIVAGLLSGLSYAVFIFGFKYAAPRGSPQSVLSIAMTVLAAVLILFANVSEVFQVPSSSEWSMFVGLGLIGAGLPFVLYIRGLKNTAPAIASVVAMVEPVTASLFGVIIMGEELADLQILGIGLILVTVTALSVYSNAKHPGYIVWKPWRMLKGKLA